MHENSLKNLNVFQKGKSGNLKGYPKGRKNRSTVAKKLLELKVDKLFKKEDLDKVMKQLPPNSVIETMEDLMTARQIIKAINQDDTNAYNAIMNNSYKPHAQEIEMREPPKAEIDLNE